MRPLIAATLLLLTLTACSRPSDSDEPVEKGIDTAAWKAELVKMPGVGPSPDMVALERITRSDCTTHVDDLALRFSLEGSDPDVTRLNMSYVCPTLAGKVDQALAQGRNAASTVDAACALTEAERTADEQALVELAGRDC